MYSLKNDGLVLIDLDNFNIKNMKISRPVIGHQEFKTRIENIQSILSDKDIDALVVYGDEYRKENLRYVSNFWPIFERGACFIPKVGKPILAGAPEGELYAREMTYIEDVRNIKEFACVTVPEEIEYPLAQFSSLSEIMREVSGTRKRIGLVGYWDLPGPIYERFKNSVVGIELFDASDILYKLRLIKTENEIACLKEAGRQACIGYKKLIEACIPGNTELEVAGAAEGAARAEGAEDINFMVFGSGKRCDTVIGRPTTKVIKDGDMIMAAMAVQYEGYVATVEFPFVSGKVTDGPKVFLNVLFEAANIQHSYLRNGCNAGEMVRAVKKVFKKYNMQEYDIYPPMHGIGLAEAESPYPDENATYLLTNGMCVNSDISLFGHPSGSNRIEEGFVIGEIGSLTLTPTIRKLVENRVYDYNEILKSL
jgi:Xaa-Pro aminopeptidase